MKNENNAYQTSHCSKLIVDYLSDSLNELKANSFQKSNKLDYIVSALVSEPSNITFLNAGKILKRARIYSAPDAVLRYRIPSGCPYYGYDKEGSFINITKPQAGRCNSTIPYLYMSDSIKCCIAEVNPSIDSVISVADILLKEDLKILNLAKNYSSSSGKGTIIEGVPNSDFTMEIQWLFACPQERAENYKITQYISEQIRKAGFDGMSYNSSKYTYIKSNGLKEHGHNFVIYNYNKCEAISSKLYRLIEVEYDIECQLTI